jgi:hypothetical protein
MEFVDELSQMKHHFILFLLGIIMFKICGLLQLLQFPFSGDMYKWNLQ